MTTSMSYAPEAGGTAVAHTSHVRPIAPYFPAFDWLRATLALTVVLGHDNVIAWEHAGSFAVQVFFALSGWLIGGILLTTQKADLPRFYFNRAIRIWIPYYIATFLLISASLFKDHIGAKWLEFVTYKLLMVFNIFGNPQRAGFEAQMPLHGTGIHFWSVNAEEQFYLICPLLLVLAPRWGRSLLLWAGLAVLALATQNLYGSIILGVLAAVAVSRYGDFHLDRRVQAACVAVLLACALGLASGGTFMILAPTFGAAAVLLLATPGKPSRIGTIAGGMSYPLYLNHWIGVFVGNALLGPFGLRESASRQMLALALNVALAVFLYVYMDRKLLAQRAQWYSESRGKTITMVAYLMVLIGLAFGIAILAGR